MMLTSVQKSPNKKSKTMKDNIISKVPVRSKEIESILSLLGEPRNMTVSSIFIYGHSATGKTFTIEKIFTELQLPFAWINCIEVYNQRLIMEEILNSLSGVEQGKENNYKGYDNCNNMSDFIRLLNNVILERQLDTQTVYLIFDNAERLRKLPSTVLAAILRLQELSRLNLCIILISEIIWDKFRGDFPLQEPFLLHFSDFNQDEALKIIEKDCPENIPFDLFSKYVKLVISFFFIATRNLQELRYIALSNFTNYYKPISLGEVTSVDSRKLWQNVAPYLTKALNSLYLRETDSLSKKNNDENYLNRAIFELPLYSKQLLIAAYIASYNAPATDKKFFLKHHGSSFKKRANKKSNTNQHEKGPKAFPLHRMLAIFYSTLNEKEKMLPSALLLSQISSLVTLKFLSCVNDSQLLNTKYKCLVSLDFIISISNSIGFQIANSLTDFTHF